MSSMTENVGLIIVQACFASTYSGQTCRAPASICALLCPGSREAQSRLGPHSPTPWAGSLYGLWHGFWTMDSSPSKSGVTLLLVFEGLHFYLCSSFMVFVGDKRNIHILMLWDNHFGLYMSYLEYHACLWTIKNPLYICFNIKERHTDQK